MPMMRAGPCVEPGTFVLQDHPVPTEAPEGWVLVDIAVAGLRSTDYHIFEGKHPYLADPRAIGHDLSGRATEAAHDFEKGQLGALVSVAKDDLTFKDPELHNREMRLVGSRNAQEVDFQTVLAVLRSGEALISTRLPPSDLHRRTGELPTDRGGIVKAVVEIAP